MRIVRIKNRIDNTVEYFYLDDHEQLQKFNNIVENVGYDNLIISEADETLRIKYLCSHIECGVLPDDLDEVKQCIVWARNEIDAREIAKFYFGFTKYSYPQIQIKELDYIQEEYVHYPDIEI